jgi:HEAT repeat protein
MTAARPSLFVSAFLVFVLAVAPASAQVTSSDATTPEASALAEGWAMLARGAVAEAAGHAAVLLGRYPNSTAVLALAVEAEIARAGATAGLDQYERWLGQKTLEEPGIVRRVARAVAREVAASNGTGRFEALRILAADGDAVALADLSTRAEAGSNVEARALAAAGDERGVKALVTALEVDRGVGVSLETIRVLGVSRNPLAFDALVAQARNREPAIRQAAMQALGALGDRRAVAVLREGLQDPFGLVQGQAAGALYRLGDDSGLPLIEQLATSESPVGRLAAAHYLSSRPDARWFALVRGLAGPGQPAEVRLGAAKLLTPHDPDEAAAVLATIGADGSVDLAVREEAWRAEPAAAAGDVRKLRGLLRSGDVLLRLSAADRLLSLTR